MNRGGFMSSESGCLEARVGGRMARNDLRRVTFSIKNVEWRTCIVLSVCSSGSEGDGNMVSQSRRTKISSNVVKQNSR